MANVWLHAKDPIGVLILFKTNLMILSRCCAGGSSSDGPATKNYAEMEHFLELHKEKRYSFNMEERDEDNKVVTRFFKEKELHCNQCKKTIRIPLCGHQQHEDRELPLFPVLWGKIHLYHKDAQKEECKRSPFCYRPHKSDSLILALCGSLDGCIAIPEESQKRIGKINQEICGICLEELLNTKKLQTCWAH
jgi:hypothetical protein